MNFDKSKIRTLALSVCIGLVATGCGSQQTKPVSQMSAAEKAQLAKVQDQVGSIVESASNLFTSAEQNDVARFSQIYFAEAKQDLAKLKEMHGEFNPNKAGLFDSGYSLDEIKEQADTVIKNVQQSEKTKQLITTHFSDIIDNQRYIESLDLSKFESTYKSLQSDVKRLFKDIEQAGQLQGLEGDKLKVLNNLRAFEVSVIKAKYFNQPQSDLEELPEGTIPVTYAEARKRLNTLSTTIEGTPRAMDTIELRQKEALKALTRAQNTLKEINWVDENSSKGLEVIVLHYHKPMDRAFPTVLKEDHSELLFEDQVSKYSYLITNLKSSIQKEVSSLDESAIKVEAEKIAEQKNKELKKQLEAQHQEALSNQSNEQGASLAKAKEEQQKAFEEEKKLLAQQHKQKMDAVIAQRDQLQLDFEKVTLELSDLKEKHQLALEQHKLKALEAKEQAPNAVSEERPATQVAAASETESTPQKNSIAEAPQAPETSTASEPAVPAASSDSFGFDFEIEDVDL